MATAKQINNTIRAVKTRVTRLTKELNEAKAKVNTLTTEYKKTVEAEKKAKATASQSQKGKSKSKPKTRKK